MSFFVLPTNAPAAKTSTIRPLSIGLAVVIIGLAVAQLFAYEKFPGLLEGLQLSGGAVSAQILAACIVIVEVFALPFLLFMKLSKAMRVTSMVAGWVSAALWVGISLWENSNYALVEHSVLLGAKLSLPVGFWSVCLSLAFAILIGWVSWGMWPLKRRS